MAICYKLHSAFSTSCWSRPERFEVYFSFLSPGSVKDKMEAAKMLTILVFALSVMVCQAQLGEAAAMSTTFNPMSTDSESFLTVRETAGPLPAPIITGNSVELCLNSRYSEHNLTGTAGALQLSYVLWGAGRAPVTGAYRDIYVATQTATFLYDANDHSVSLYSGDVTSTGAFSIRYNSELAFDAGLSYMPAILASVFFWQSSGSSIASCPKGVQLYFGVQGVRGFTPELVARSSVPEGEPGWLPDPSTTGENSLKVVLANLNYVNNFVQINLTLQQISQILWAGYGCTPHTGSYGRAGLTVPSAHANYYLTGTIYLANQNGVYRYHNRNPSTDLTTRDHRIEQINSDDVRGGLQSAVSGLPQAPCYVILCLDSSYVGQRYAHLETGFVAGNMLIQASAIGLGCHFKTELPSGEQGSIQTATSIPSSHIPQVVVSIGGVDIVEFEDYARFAEHWLKSGSGLASDLDGDLDVDWFDLQRFVDEWLASCPYNWPLR